MTEYEIKRLEDRIRELWNEKEDLLKENAELKSENRRIKTCTNCDEYVIGRCCNYPNGVCHHWKLSGKYRNDDKLIKATELLKWALHSDPEHDDLTDFDTKWKEAEQFIKETENDS